MRDGGFLDMQDGTDDSLDSGHCGSCKLKQRVKEETLTWCGDYARKLFIICNILYLLLDIWFLVIHMTGASPVLSLGEESFQSRTSASV